MKLGYGLDELFNKHNILLIGTERIYVQSLRERDYVLENTTPFSIVIDNFLEIKVKAWTKVVEGVAKYLQTNYPLPLEELYAFRTNWSKAAVFAPEKFLDNCVQIGEKLYVSQNFTALHSLWFIQDLLEKYEINLSSCYLLIHRSPVSEPVEVQDAVRTAIMGLFTEFLIDNKCKSKEAAENIVKNFKYINAVLSKITRSYYDFFLFDSANLLSTYKSKLLIDYKSYCGWTEKQRDTAKKYLDYYTEFFTELKKTLKFKSYIDRILSINSDGTLKPL